MKNLLCTLGISVLLCVAAAAQQTTPSTSDQNQASPPSTSATQNPSTTTQPTSPSTTQSDQSQGGAPQSAEPGRVTGDVPTQVQQALNRQLPASDQVTASVADDGSLKLTGTVSNARDKEQAEDIARSATNKQIDNKIEVRSSNSPSSTSTPR